MKKIQQRLSLGKMFLMSLLGAILALYGVEGRCFGLYCDPQVYALIGFLLAGCSVVLGVAWIFVQIQSKREKSPKGA